MCTIGKDKFNMEWIEEVEKKLDRRYIANAHGS